MTEQNATIYNVDINGQKRKAFDILALKGFIESKKSFYSMLNLNPEGINPTDSVHKYIAKAAISTLTEIEDAIDQALGLNQVPAPEPEPEQVSAPVDDGKIDLDEVMKESDVPDEAPEPEPEQVSAPVSEPKVATPAPIPAPAPAPVVEEEEAEIVL